MLRFQLTCEMHGNRSMHLGGRHDLYFRTLHEKTNHALMTILAGEVKRGDFVLSEEKGLILKSFRGKVFETS